MQWINEADGDALIEAGWLVHKSGDPANGAWFMSEEEDAETAYFDAISSFYCATGIDPDQTAGCGCCGAPHSFEAETEEEYHDGWRNFSTGEYDEHEPFDYRDGAE